MRTNNHRLPKRYLASVAMLTALTVGGNAIGQDFSGVLAGLSAATAIAAVIAAAAIIAALNFASWAGKKVAGFFRSS